MKRIRDLALPGRADLIEFTQAILILLRREGVNDMTEHRLVALAEIALARGAIEGLDRAKVIFTLKVPS